MGEVGRRHRCRDEQQGSGKGEEKSQAHAAQFVAFTPLVKTAAT
jgi:hypothetical protein